MPSERQKFPKKGHFLPTGEQEFPKNGQFYASRRTKISRKRPFFASQKTKIFRESPFFCQPKDRKFPKTTIFVLVRRTRISRKRPVLRQPKEKKMNPATIFPSPGWEIPTKIPPPKGRKSEKNFRKNWKRSYFPQTEPGFFHAAGQMTSRKSRIAGTFLHRTARIFYVSLPGNVRSTRRKPTFPDRKTYGLHTGNIENIKEKKGYPTDIFRIRNTEKTNGPFTGKEQKSRIRKNRGNSLRGNLQKTRKIKAD